MKEDYLELSILRSHTHRDHSIPLHINVIHINQPPILIHYYYKPPLPPTKQPSPPPSPLNEQTNVTMLYVMGSPAGYMEVSAVGNNECSHPFGREAKQNKTKHHHGVVDVTNVCQSVSQSVIVFLHGEEGGGGKHEHITIIMIYN